MQNSHLYRQMERIITQREIKGWETNPLTLRIWLEWADRPFGEGDEGDVERIFGRDWFTPLPRYGCDGTSCWIAPSGLIWSIGYANHWFFGDVSGLGQDGMERAGFLHVSGGHAHKYYELTPQQERALERINADCRQIDRREVRVNDTARPVSWPQFKTMPEDNPAMRAFNRAPRAEYDWKDPANWRAHSQTWDRSALHTNVRIWGVMS